MSDKKQRNNGITLIALVITIIILLILAGVTIAMLTGNNGILKQASDAKIMTNLSKVDEAIKLYKSNLKIEKVVNEENSEEVTNDDLINDKTLKEYVIEETLRPIAVVEGYDKLGIKDEFGEGYKNINEYNIDGESTPYIGTLNELNNVCAIDLIDGTLYYLENGKVWSIEGKTEIANNYERVNAEEAEWTFNASTKTLTAYNGDLATVRREQEVGEVIVPNYYEGTRVSAIGNRVFNENTALTKLTISKGIQVIGGGAFFNCSGILGEVVIPKTIKNIGNESFQGCTSISELIIEEGCTAVISGGWDGWNYRGVFSGCSNVSTVVLPKSIVKISEYGFYGCKNISTLKYRGNEEEFNYIQIGNNNTSLLSAKRIYNFT